MAQTKTARTRASGAKRTSSRSASNGSRAKSSKRSGSSNSRSNGKSSGRTRSASASRRSGGAARKASQPSTLSKVTEKAKGPAIAGGAALVGLAGGMALKNGKRNGRSGMPRPKLNLSMPKPKGSTVKIVGGAAKEIAKGGYKIGQLTSEVRKVREAVEAKDK
jgi:hypothetical protein